MVTDFFSAEQVAWPSESSPLSRLPPPDRTHRPTHIPQLTTYHGIEGL